MSQVRVKKTIRGLDVIQAVYAFIMALGLREIFLGSYFFLTEVPIGSDHVTAEKYILMLALFVNALLLGLRFFWVPRNLRRLVCVVGRLHGSLDKHSGLSNPSIAGSFVAIFLHAGLFYMVCAEAKFVLFVVSSTLTLDHTVFSTYIILHISLLALNAAWISLLTRQEKALINKNKEKAETLGVAPGAVWWRNNLISSLIALSPFTVASACQSSVFKCAQIFNYRDHIGTMLLPSSPVIFSSVFETISNQFVKIGVSTQFGVIYWVMCFLFINSAVDLLNTGRLYLIVEELDIEEEPTANAGS